MLDLISMVDYLGHSKCKNPSGYHLRRAVLQEESTLQVFLRNIGISKHKINLIVN